MKRIALPTLTLALLTGCMKVGPDFKAPSTDVQKKWIDMAHKNIDPEAALPVNWWERFNDSKLNELVAMAREQNLSLKIAASRIVESRAVLGIAIGEFFPQTQQLEGDATRVHVSKNAANSAGIDRQYKTYTGGFRLKWELDFWGRYRRGIEAADAAFEAELANYDETLLLLLSEVASTYIRMRIIDEQIDIVEQNLKLQQRSLDIVDARFRNGFVTQLDVAQAKTLLQDTKSQLPPLEAQRRIASNALSALLGWTPDQGEAHFLTAQKLSAIPMKAELGMPAAILTRRPDVKRALMEAASQSARVGIAVSDFFPRISFSGFIGLQSSGGNHSQANTTTTKERSTVSFGGGGPSVSSTIKNSVSTKTAGHGGAFLSRSSLTFAYGPQFFWPVLDYGRIKNAVAAERARLDQTVLNYRNTVLGAYQEAEDSVVRYIKSIETHEILEEGVVSAERATEIASRQYVEGIADYTRVIETLRAQLVEQSRLVEAKGEMALGLVAIYKSVGVV